MTIQADPSQVVYAGDGTTVAFAIPFPFDTSADIGVVLTDSDGAPTRITTGFSITGGSGSTGTLTMDTAPALNESLTIFDDPELTQPADYTTNDSFPADSHEAALDRTVRQVKRLKQRVDRSIRVADGDTSDGDDLLLPLEAARAGKYLAFDANGNPTASEGTGGGDSALRTDLASTSASADGSRLSGYRREESGSVARSVGSKLDDIVNVLDWGTDQTALQAAADYAESTGAHLIGAPITVTLTSTLVLNCIGDLSMLTVEGDSEDFTPLVRVGTITGNPTQLNGQLRLPKVSNTSKPSSGWAGQQVGVELANLYQSEIYVPEISKFAVGLDCGGHTSGFSYNNIYLGNIIWNEVGVRLQGKATTSAWANQNQFYGGRVWIPSSEGSSVSGARYVQLIPLDVTVDDETWPNNNTFIGTSFELNVPEYQAEIAGANNMFINCRWESATTPAVKLTGHASLVLTYENCIMGGVNVVSIAFTESGVCRYNGIINPRIMSLNGSGSVINLRNEGSSDHPLIQGFEPSVNAMNETNAATDWSLRINASGIQGKATADVSALVDINFPNGIGQFRRVKATAAAISSATGVVCFGNTTQTTVGAAGGATALPATPTGYLRFFIGTSEFVIPYYAQA